ncbi:MAG: 16S rRNA (cytosine(967)-C(5))-methyltransferase RsmB [Verrucomicrobiales bacterium]|nr:16S rRNA (cytosine(967)-C(5))-methyltransferase RsmB [Verrucomicrobiales bacterium]
MSSRRCALESLTEWEDTSRYAEDILADRAKRFGLSSPDRALAVDILYGTIRNLFLLDGIIDELRRGSIKPDTQDLLRIGLYQLFCSDIAEHAAVNETVNLARNHERGLVNAILRNAQRQKEELTRKIASWSLEDRFSHPGELIERWVKQFGEEETAKLCEWNNQPPQNYARINPLASDEEALKRVRSETEASWVGENYPDFFRFEGAPNHEWLDQGLIYVQDPSTTHACQLLDPKPGETILDACAAPGGKTSLLAAMMNNEGSIVATDNSTLRLERTEENLDRLGVKNVEIREQDWTLQNDPEPLFDGILLDVPCSNSGVMRRRVDVRWRLQPGDITRHAELQQRILQGASRALKPGGRIVYSTCSIDAEENEKVIEASGLTIEKVTHALPWRDGFDGSFAALLRP